MSITIIILGIVKPLFRFNVVFLFLAVIFSIPQYTNPPLFILFSKQFLFVIFVVVSGIPPYTDPSLFILFSKQFCLVILVL